MLHFFQESKSTDYHSVSVQRCSKIVTGASRATYEVESRLSFI